MTEKKILILARKNAAESTYTLLPTGMTLLKAVEPDTAGQETMSVCNLGLTAKQVKEEVVLLTPTTAPH